MTLDAHVLFLFLVGMFKKAVECVESYLLFHPNDEDMQKNQEFYRDQMKINPLWFIARKEAQIYKDLSENEARLLSFINLTFESEIDEISNYSKPEQESNFEQVSD